MFEQWRRSGEGRSHAVGQTRTSDKRGDKRSQRGDKRSDKRGDKRGNKRGNKHGYKRVKIGGHSVGEARIGDKPGGTKH